MVGLKYEIEISTNVEFGVTLVELFSMGWSEKPEFEKMSSVNLKKDFKKWKI